MKTVYDTSVARKPKEKKEEVRALTPSDVGKMLGAIGATGSIMYKGYYNLVDELEYVNELQGSMAIDTYNQMRKSDGQVQLALLALMNPVINAEWKLHPPGDPEHDDVPTPEELEQTKIMNDWIFGEDFEFTQTMRQILGMFWAGFSVFEKLWWYDEQKKLLCIKKLSPRLQNTIREWDIQDGNLVQIRQVIFAGETKRDVWIPADKAVVFTYQKEGDDYRGISALRPAYKHWFYKDFFYRIDGMRIERWGLGVPVITEEEVASTAGGKAKIIEAVENMRAHEKGYIYLPRGYKVELLDAGQGKMVDPIPSIQHHDAAILKTIMAHFLELGMTETGARSVGETLQNAYLLSLQSVANYVAETLNKHVIRDVARKNFGDNVRTPYLKATGIQPEDFDLFAKSFQSLGSSNLVTKGPKLEGFIRETLGIPNEDEEFMKAMLDRQMNPPVPPAPGGFQKPEDKSEDEPKKEEPGKEDQSEESADMEDEAKAKKKPESVANKHVHSQACGHKLNSAPEFVSRGTEAPNSYLSFWRPLKSDEEHVSLRAISGKLDDSREEGVRATRKAREAVVAQLIPQVRKAVAEKNIKAVMKIDYSNEVYAGLVQSLEAALWDVYDFGSLQVFTELRKATNSLTLASKPLDAKALRKKHGEVIHAQAQQSVEVSLDKIVDAARDWAATGVRTGDLDEIAFIDDLERFSENQVRKSVGYTVNEAFALGRKEAIEALKSEIQYASYSAILDNNVCENCYAIDARNDEYELGSAEFEKYSPPLYNCEGGNYCRCQWILHFKGERAPQA